MKNPTRVIKIYDYNFCDTKVDKMPIKYNLTEHNQFGIFLKMK